MWNSRPQYQINYLNRVEQVLERLGLCDELYFLPHDWDLACPDAFLKQRRNDLFRSKAKCLFGLFLSDMHERQECGESIFPPFLLFGLHIHKILVCERDGLVNYSVIHLGLKQLNDGFGTFFISNKYALLFRQSDLRRLPILDFGQALGEPRPVVACREFHHPWLIRMQPAGERHPIPFVARVVLTRQADFVFVPRLILLLSHHIKFGRLIYHTRLVDNHGADDC